MKNSLRAFAALVSAGDNDRDLFVSQVVADVDFSRSIDLLLRAKLWIVDVYRHAHVVSKLPIVANKSFSDETWGIFSLYVPTIGKYYKTDARNIANSSQLWPN